MATCNKGHRFYRFSSGKPLNKQTAAATKLSGEI